MLGHWHRIDGAVIGGDRRGRELGYPTANMSILGLHPPRFGVYAVKVDVLTGPHAGSYHGAASHRRAADVRAERAPIWKPFCSTSPAISTASTCRSALVDYLRARGKFDGLEALIAQMDADCARAREILAAL